MKKNLVTKVVASGSLYRILVSKKFFGALWTDIKMANYSNQNLICFCYLKPHMGVYIKYARWPGGRGSHPNACRLVQGGRRGHSLACARTKGRELKTIYYKPSKD